MWQERDSKSGVRSEEVQGESAVNQDTGQGETSNGSGTTQIHWLAWVGVCGVWCCKVVRCVCVVTYVWESVRSVSMWKVGFQIWLVQKLDPPASGHQLSRFDLLWQVLHVSRNQSLGRLTCSVRRWDKM